MNSYFCASIIFASMAVISAFLSSGRAPIWAMLAVAMAILSVGDKLEAIRNSIRNIK